jgi:DNA/RNA endonuclease YhcR with UshA esterase domain
MIKRILFLSLVLVFAVGTAAAQTCADIHGVGTDGCAPSPLDGTTVSLTGIVYVPAGTYNSGAVYLDCPNGGITFFDSAAAGVLFEGDDVTITGVVGYYGDEIQINGTTWVINSSGNVAIPTMIGTGDLADGTDQLGDFMAVQGVLSLVSSGFNSTYSIDDGSGPVIVFVDGTTGIDTAVVDAMVGDYIKVGGSTKCYNGEGEILPRRTADFCLISVPNEATSISDLKASYDE